MANFDKAITIVGYTGNTLEQLNWASLIQPNDNCFLQNQNGNFINFLEALYGTNIKQNQTKFRNQQTLSEILTNVDSIEIVSKGSFDGQQIMFKCKDYKQLYLNAEPLATIFSTNIDINQKTVSININATGTAICQHKGQSFVEIFGNELIGLLQQNQQNKIQEILTEGINGMAYHYLGPNIITSYSYQLIENIKDKSITQELKQDSIILFQYFLTNWDLFQHIENDILAFRKRVAIDLGLDDQFPMILFKQLKEQAKLLLKYKKLSKQPTKRRYSCLTKNHQFPKQIITQTTFQSGILGNPKINNSQHWRHLKQINQRLTIRLINEFQLENKPQLFFKDSYLKQVNIQLSNINTLERQYLKLQNEQLIQNQQLEFLRVKVKKYDKINELKLIQSSYLSLKAKRLNINKYYIENLKHIENITIENINQMNQNKDRTIKRNFIETNEEINSLKSQIEISKNQFINNLQKLYQGQIPQLQLNQQQMYQPIIDLQQKLTESKNNCKDAIKQMKKKFQQKYSLAKKLSQKTQSEKYTIMQKIAEYRLNKFGSPENQQIKLFSQSIKEFKTGLQQQIHKKYLKYLSEDIETNIASLNNTKYSKLSKQQICRILIQQQYKNQDEIKMWRKFYGIQQKEIQDLRYQYKIKMLQKAINSLNNSGLKNSSRQLQVFKNIFEKINGKERMFFTNEVQKFNQQIYQVSLKIKQEIKLNQKKHQQSSDKIEQDIEKLQKHINQIMDCIPDHLIRKKKYFKFNQSDIINNTLVPIKQRFKGGMCYGINQLFVLNSELKLMDERDFMDSISLITNKLNLDKLDMKQKAKLDYLIRVIQQSQILNVHSQDSSIKEHKLIDGQIQKIIKELPQKSSERFNIDLVRSEKTFLGFKYQNCGKHRISLKKNQNGTYDFFDPNHGGGVQLNYQQTVYLLHKSVKEYDKILMRPRHKTKYMDCYFNVKQGFNCAITAFKYNLTHFNEQKNLLGNRTAKEQWKFPNLERFKQPQKPIVRSSKQMRLIIQLQGDQISKVSCQSLYGKKPQQSSIIQAKQGINSDSFKIIGNEIQFSQIENIVEGGKLKLLFCAHGNQNCDKIGGKNAKELGNLIQKYLTHLTKKGNTFKSFEISLIGCKVAQNILVKQLAKQFKKFQKILKIKFNSQNFQVRAQKYVTKINSKGMKQFLINNQWKNKEQMQKQSIEKKQQKGKIEQNNKLDYQTRKLTVENNKVVQIHQLKPANQILSAIELCLNSSEMIEQIQKQLEKNLGEQYPTDQAIIIKKYMISESTNKFKDFMVELLEKQEHAKYKDWHVQYLDIEKSGDEYIIKMRNKAKMEEVHQIRVKDHSVVQNFKKTTQQFSKTLRKVAVIENNKTTYPKLEKFNHWAGIYFMIAGLKEMITENSNNDQMDTMQHFGMLGARFQIILGASMTVTQFLSDNAAFMKLSIQTSKNFLQFGKVLKVFSVLNAPIDVLNIINMIRNLNEYNYPSQQKALMIANIVVTCFQFLTDFTMAISVFVTLQEGCLILAFVNPLFVFTTIALSFLTMGVTKLLQWKREMENKQNKFRMCKSQAMRTVYRHLKYLYQIKHTKQVIFTENQNGYILISDCPITQMNLNDMKITLGNIHIDNLIDANKTKYYPQKTLQQYQFDDSFIRKVSPQALNISQVMLKLLCSPFKFQQKLNNNTILELPTTPNIFLHQRFGCCSKQNQQFIKQQEMGCQLSETQKQRQQRQGEQIIRELDKLGTQQTNSFSIIPQIYRLRPIPPKIFGRQTYNSEKQIITGFDVQYESIFTKIILSPETRTFLFNPKQKSQYYKGYTIVGNGGTYTVLCEGQNIFGIDIKIKQYGKQIDKEQKWVFCVDIEVSDMYAFSYDSKYLPIQFNQFNNHYSVISINRKNQQLPFRILFDESTNVSVKLTIKANKQNYKSEFLSDYCFQSYIFHFNRQKYKLQITNIEANNNAQMFLFYQQSSNSNNLLDQYYQKVRQNLTRQLKDLINISEYCFPELSYFQFYDNVCLIKTDSENFTSAILPLQYNFKMLFCLYLSQRIKSLLQKPYPQTQLPITEFEKLLLRKTKQKTKQKFVKQIYLRIKSMIFDVKKSDKKRYQKINYKEEYQSNLQKTTNVSIYDEYIKLKNQIYQNKINIFYVTCSKIKLLNINDQKNLISHYFTIDPQGYQQLQSSYCIVSGKQWSAKSQINCKNLIFQIKQLNIRFHHQQIATNKLDKLFLAKQTKQSLSKFIQNHQIQFENHSKYQFCNSFTLNLKYLNPRKLNTKLPKQNSKRFVYIKNMQSQNVYELFQLSIEGTENEQYLCNYNNSQYCFIRTTNSCYKIASTIDKYSHITKFIIQLPQNNDKKIIEIPAKLSRAIQLTVNSKSKMPIILSFSQTIFKTDQTELYYTVDSRKLGLFWQSSCALFLTNQFLQSKKIVLNFTMVYQNLKKIHETIELQRQIFDYIQQVQFSQKLSQSYRMESANKQTQTIKIVKKDINNKKSVEKLKISAYKIKVVLINHLNYKYIPNYSSQIKTLLLIDTETDPNRKQVYHVICENQCKIIIKSSNPQCQNRWVLMRNNWTDHDKKYIIEKPSKELVFFYSNNQFEEFQDWVQKQGTK